MQLLAWEYHLPLVLLQHIRLGRLGFGLWRLSARLAGLLFFRCVCLSRPVGRGKVLNYNLRVSVADGRSINADHFLYLTLPSLRVTARLAHDIVG